MPTIPASPLTDTRASYGWVSIVLHWVTAIAVIGLWLLGKRIDEAASATADLARARHVSFAASAWLLLLLRIVWRLRSGHPHVRGQGPLIHRVSSFNHYALIVAVAVMMLSGPLMVWASGNPVAIFNLAAIPSPFSASDTLQTIARTLHGAGGATLLVLFLLHFCGAMKHLMFHDDDTIARMIWPGTRGDHNS